MFETFKEVDEQTIIKELTTSFSSNKKTSLQTDNVEDLYDINYLIIIEAGVTKTEKIGQLKDDHVYLLNDMKYYFQDQLLENVMDDDNKKDESVEKVMLLTSKLIEK